MRPQRVEWHDIEALVARAREGSNEAFEALVEAHQHEVFGLALRLVVDRELAADVSQEAFIRAWRALPDFRGDAAFSTWLYRITVNVAWTLKKRKDRHAAQPLDESPELADVRRRSDPEHAGENSELRAKLAAALDDLNPAHRSVVVLKDIYGWSHSEVAESLGISVTAAKVRLHRAHLKLREQLRELEDRQ
ncbi:MAG TPA: sigma-70 family RNA polymerase sigma factor [Acidimicrobiia bacterium]|nr:sigma-70 family RNA polymerase sigma factor [Acidimicrobiia bacterium]